MSAVENFNPDALMLRPGSLSVRCLDQGRKINLIRPNADFLWLLQLEISNRVTNSNQPETAKALKKANYGAFILVIAARERLLSDSDARWVESTFDFWKTGAEMLLAKFQLFKAVATVAAALNAETPLILQNEREAWGQSVLRIVESEINETQENSLNQYSSRLRKAAKSLSEGANPFGSDEPELQLLIDYARRLSCHEASEANHLKSVKKQVRQAIDRYRRSLLAEANFKRKDKRVVQTFVVHGKHHFRSVKNHIENIPCTEPLSVSGGTPFKLSG